MSPVNRTAPRGGYAFQTKAQYRRAVWDALLQVPNWQAGHPWYLLMPSSEGLELAHLQQRRRALARTCVVDRNAAIVASLRRRYPTIHTYGVSLSRAAKGSGTREGNRRPTETATYTGKRNLRDVWFISPRPYSGAHFATFPESLVEPCLLAGSKPGDLVLDPFAGAGTVGLVASRLGRDFLGIDLNVSYLLLAMDRWGLSLNPKEPEGATS